MNTNKLVKLSLLLAISVVISYFESFIPTIVPGVKLGLANVISLILIYNYDYREAFVVIFLRILIVSFIRGTFLNYPFYMSLCGGLLAYLAMIVFRKLDRFTEVGVSVAGAFYHTLGQILVATLFTKTVEIIYLFCFIALFCIITGIISGLIANKLNKHYKKMI